MKGAVALLRVASILPACSAFGGSQLLSADIGYWMTWTYTNTSLTITLTANTTGYLGLGFSHSGSMVGADVVTITSLGGNITIQDRHGVDAALPPLDVKQDYILLNGSVSNGKMKATFTRALDTCDPDDMAIKVYTKQLIYAYGTVDGSGAPQYHSSNRGSVKAYIMNTVPTQPTDLGIFYIDPIPRPINISDASDSIYWCSVVQFPNVTNKSHIIEMQPVITAGNEDIVHHILVYACSSVNLNYTSFDRLNGYGGGNMDKCTTLLAAWAIGAGAYTFPPNVGLPIGGGNSPQYILIQTHYSNRMLASGRIDRSYIRFQVTRNLRKYDAGILETGIIEGILVPPNVSQMQISGYCSSDCLGAMNLPATGINIFSVLLHSHLLGRRVAFRNLRSAPTPQTTMIADDPYYDLEYQQIWNLDTFFNVLPGDILQTVCTMSSVSLNVSTQGGLGTYQEMCLSFAFYYPKINLKVCQSAPPFVFNSADPFYQRVGIKISSFSWGGAESEAGLVGAKWSPQLTEAIQDAYFNGSNGGVCLTDRFTSRVLALPSLASTALPNASAISLACYQSSSSSSKTTPMKAASAQLAILLMHHVSTVSYLRILMAAYVCID